MTTIHHRHHIVPSSRGGPDIDWNLGYFRTNLEEIRTFRIGAFKKSTPVAYEYLLHGNTHIDQKTLLLSGIDLEIHRFLHACLHSIFSNALPSEQIESIKSKYTNKDGSLNKRYFPGRKPLKKIKSWAAVFGEESVNNTQIAIDFIEKYFLPVEQYWRKDKKKRK
ncbi:MAG: hypothetical protein UT82_C0034G0002 [Parcubacteria group bacterium GW2011_GWB1_40_14]|nr:MAG: hypothetical protein UT82_C0034G0002 [Parcubacteria group bacterium GW2011_GWB1_40_14]